MEPREKELLNKTAKLAEENNRILKSLQRKSRLETAWKILKWVVIFILFYYAYQALLPVYTQLLDVYSGVQETKDSVLELKAKTENIPGLGNLFGE